MKFIIILASFVAIVAASTVNFNQKHVAGQAGKSFEMELRVLVEKFRRIIDVGSEELDTPILDPLQMETFLMNLEIPDLAKIHIDLTGAVLDGLRDFVIRDISFSLPQLRIDFNVTFPLMKCTAKNYILTGKIYDDVEIYGEGKAEVGMINLEADTFGSVVIQDGHLFMNKFEAVLRMDKFSSNLEGLMGGGAAGDIFNEVVEELIPAIAISEKDKLSAFIGNIVMRFANRHLTHMTLQDFLDFIHGLK